MKKKSILRCCLFAIVALVLIAAVPIAINELYKKNTGYITVWGGADVLSYYGTILGACVTIGALCLTILFTKRQIQRDSYLKSQEEKWGKIEELVSNSLEKIHPTHISEITEKASNAQYIETISALHLYSFQAKSTLDSLFGYISEADYKQIEPLLTAIHDEVDKYCEISAKYDVQFQNLITLEIRKNAIDIYNKAQQNPTLFAEYILSSQKTISETDGLNSDEIWAELSNLGVQLVSMRNNSYRNLLEVKRKTFSDIRSKWIIEADTMLHLWGE